MLYYAVPQNVIEDTKLLSAWASKAQRVAMKV